MTDMTTIHRLISLSDSDLTVANPDDDVRGRKVLDRNREEIGSVDDLLLDDQDHKVRFLRVNSGGFLGIGQDTTVIPIDAITRIDKDHVHLDQTRENVSKAPRYDPALVQDDPGYWGGVYGHYGFAPYWGPGYVYPGYPFLV